MSFQVVKRQSLELFPIAETFVENHVEWVRSFFIRTKSEKFEIVQFLKTNHFLGRD